MSFKGFVVYTIQFVSHPYLIYYNTYEMEFPLGEYDFQSRLTVDPEVSELMLAHLEKEGENYSAMRVVVRLHHHSLNNDLGADDKEFDINKTAWKESLNKAGKHQPTGLSHYPVEGAHLAQNLSRIDRALTSSFESKILTGLIDYIKQLLINDPSFREVGKVQLMLGYAHEAGLDAN